jgi:hypothetical protein
MSKTNIKAMENNSQIIIYQTEKGELNEALTCKDFLQVGKEGGRMVERSQKFYNLDAIISVGYRIKSTVATRFRQWATKHIKIKCTGLLQAKPQQK